MSECEKKVTNTVLQSVMGADSETFQNHLARTVQYLKGRKDGTYYFTVARLIEDNSKMYKRLEELGEL